MKDDNIALYSDSKQDTHSLDLSDITTDEKQALVKKNSNQSPI